MSRIGGIGASGGISGRIVCWRHGSHEVAGLARQGPHDLRDLIGVGLIDADWPAQLPPPFNERLQQLLDNPNG